MPAHGRGKISTNLFFLFFFKGMKLNKQWKRRNNGNEMTFLGHQRPLQSGHERPLQSDIFTA